MTPATFFSLLGWVIVGSLSGYVASLVLRAEKQGCFINIALGVAGAIVGSFLVQTFLPRWFALFGTGPVATFLNTVFHAFVGAVALLILAEIVLPGKQLGVREGDEKPRRSSRRRR